jgi:hypothetical protein
MTAAPAEIAAWRASGDPYKLIAAAMAEWAAMQRPGTPLLGDDSFRVVDAHPSTFKRARTFLVTQGVLEAGDGPHVVAFISTRPVGSPAAGRDTTQDRAVPPSPLACQPAARASSRRAGWLGRADRDGRGSTRLRLAPVARASHPQGTAAGRVHERAPGRRATVTETVRKEAM